MFPSQTWRNGVSLQHLGLILRKTGMFNLWFCLQRSSEWQVGQWKPFAVPASAKKAGEPLPKSAVK